MSVVYLAIGLVLCVEGLALALAPLRMEDLLRHLAEMPPERRRMFGLGARALGVVLVWAARALGG